MAERSNVSNDLVWQIARSQNSFLVKRRTGGGSQFSRDPMNLVNSNTYKNAGFANKKAVGVQPAENGGVVTMTKKPGNAHQPAQNVVSVNYGPNASSRKIFKGVADQTAKRDYRGDLREDAVARVSAIRNSQRPKKDTPAKKLRGTQAKKAAEKAAEGA